MSADPDDYQELFFPLLDRMVTAGMLQQWTFAAGRLELSWADDFLGQGPGDRAFVRMAQALSALYPESGMTEAEHATLLDLAVFVMDQSE